MGPRPPDLSQLAILPTIGGAYRSKKSMLQEKFLSSQNRVWSLFWLFLGPFKIPLYVYSDLVDHNMLLWRHKWPHMMETIRGWWSDWTFEEINFFFSKVTLVDTLKQTYLHFNPFLIIYCQQVRCLFRITLSRISFKKIIDTIGHFFLSMSLFLSDPFALEVE